MSTLKFKMNELEELLDELESATSFHASVEQIFDAANYPDGVIRDSEGRSEAEVIIAGECFLPCADQMTDGVIKPSLVLVGDNGVYLGINAKRPHAPSSRGAVAYAEGCNPDVDKDFYETQVGLVGDYDRTDEVPLSWVELAKDAEQGSFNISLTNDVVKLEL